MSVCTTCLKPGLPADDKHTCPGLGDIQLTRQLGHGLRVDTAPARARMDFAQLASEKCGATVVGDDLINIADQVLYQVVGYDPESAALVLELVEDWRPKCAPDATVCTPIPAETLIRMSEVPPELLTEQQRTRADNAEERLRLAREALVEDGYFTADQVGPAAAPRIVEWLSHHRDRAEEAEAELARLRAGEEPGWDPMVVPTPGQWIARWNKAPTEERLRVAEAHIRNAEIANRCHFEAHRQRLEEDQQAWATVARVRDLRDSWLLMTLEPGQVRRLLDDITRALDGPEGAGENETTPPDGAPCLCGCRKGDHKPWCHGCGAECTCEPDDTTRSNAHVPDDEVGEYVSPDKARWTRGVLHMGEPVEQQPGGAT